MCWMREAAEPPRLKASAAATAAAAFHPRSRKNSITPAAVRTGNVIRISSAVTKMFQVKIGIRNIVMPGARIVNTVAITAIQAQED